jgi:3-oxoacyl-[acyl-carrier-protein] synthase-3
VTAATPIQAAITGVHGHLPADVLDNETLARMVDTSDAWITERTGIKERRILKGKGLGTSHMAAEAVRGLLKRTATRPQDVDLLICATTTPDFVFPSTANIVCDMVGIRNIGSFDVQAACSGFVYALTIAAQFIGTGQARKVVVVGADKMSAIIDYTDRATCVLFGDGAGAVVLEAQTEQGKTSDRGVLTTHLRSDGRHKSKLYVDGGPSSTQTVGLLRMEGREVFKHAVGMITDVIVDAFNATGLTAEDIDWFIPHQANKRIIDASAHKLHIAPQKVVLTVDLHGNTSAASIPLALAVAVKDGRVKKGDLVLFEAMGGGFTWGSALVRW